MWHEHINLFHISQINIQPPLIPVCLWSSVGSLWHFMIVVAPWSCATFCRHVVHFIINHWFFCMFRSQFIESSIVLFKNLFIMCRWYTIRLHSTACQTWQCLQVYGDVFWMCCWGFQAQCFGNDLFLLWGVKICIEQGSVERVILIYGHRNDYSYTMLTWKVISRGKNRKVTNESYTYPTRNWNSCLVLRFQLFQGFSS